MDTFLARLPRWAALDRVSGTYVALVGALATVGMALQAPTPFVVAALLALPTTLVAVPAYYILYGLVALIPGANPASSSGTGQSTPSGGSVTVVAGEPALWFTITMAVMAVVVLVLAAYANAVLFKAVRRRVRPQSQVPA